MWKLPRYLAEYMASLRHQLKVRRFREILKTLRRSVDRQILIAEKAIDVHFTVGPWIKRSIPTCKTSWKQRRKHRKRFENRGEYYFVLHFHFRRDNRTELL